MSPRLQPGARFGPSSWITVSQGRIDTFAEATSHRHWIHSDPERARTGPYGATVAQGYLTISLLPAFLTDLLDEAHEAVDVNYGLNRVRFPAAVRAGARLRATLLIEDVRPVAWGAQISLTATVEQLDHSTPVCVAELLVRRYTLG